MNADGPAHLKKLHDHDEMVFLYQRVLHRLRMADGMPEDPFLFDSMAEGGDTAHFVMICRRAGYRPARMFRADESQGFSPRFILLGRDREENDVRLRRIIVGAAKSRLFDVFRMTGRDFVAHEPTALAPRALVKALCYLERQDIDANFNDSAELSRQADALRAQMGGTANPAERDVARAHFMKVLYERVKLSVIPSLCEIRTAERVVQIADTRLMPMIEDALELRKTAFASFLPFSLAGAIGYLYQ